MLKKKIHSFPNLLNKNTIAFLLSKNKIILSCAMLLFLPTFAFAVGNVTVTYPGAPGPLFNETNIVPGDTITKTITVTNNTAVNEQHKFRATAKTSLGNLASKINLRVINVGTGVERRNGTLANLYSTGEVNLDVLAPNTPTSYNFIVTFDPNAGNEYMGMTETLDLDIGFAAAPTTDPATTGGTSTPASPFVALATALGFVPTNVVTTDTPAVAGVETVAETPEVKGSDDKAGEARGSSDRVCPWWWIVGLVFLIVLAFVGGVVRTVKKDNIIRKYYYLWPIMLGLIAWIAHYYLEKGYQETWYCQWYWLLTIIVVIAAEAIYYLLLQKSGQKQT